MNDNQIMTPIAIKLDGVHTSEVKEVLTCCNDLHNYTGSKCIIDSMDYGKRLNQ